MLMAVGNPPRCDRPNIGPRGQACAPQHALIHFTLLPLARPDCTERHSSNSSCWSSVNTQAPVFFTSIAFARTSPVIEGPASRSDSNFNFVRVICMPANGLRSFFSISLQVLRVFSWVVVFEEKLQMQMSNPQRCMFCKCCTVTSLTIWLNSMVWWQSNATSGPSDDSDRGAVAFGAPDAEANATRAWHSANFFS